MLEFKNKVVIVDIMGTWCPNCHDEEPLLVDLYNRYHKDGLEIVGLAYEYTDDAAQNARSRLRSSARSTTCRIPS